MPVNTQFIFANFFETELVAGLTAADTTILISPEDSLKLPLFLGPNQESRLTIWDGQLPPEIVACTSNPQTGALTVIRGQESTVAQAWAAGTQVRCSVTAEIVNEALLAYFNFVAVLNASFLPLAGGTLTGPLVLPGNPTLGLQAAPKQYVDSVQGIGLPTTGGTMSGPINMNGEPILNLPAPTVNGNPATKGYSDSTYATFVSPAFTGNPTAPTQGPGDNSTKLATTAYADAVAGSVAPAWTTGDVKLTLKTVADPTWIMCDDTSIGPVGSPAVHTATANQALFELIWNNVPDTWAPVTPGGRGASAVADWNSGTKQIALTKMLGRALALGGTGSGLNPRPLGSTVGEETHTLSIPELPSHTHSITDVQHTHAVSNTNLLAEVVGGLFTGSASQLLTPITFSISAAFSGITGTNATGGGIAFNQMQPTTFLNAMIKV